MDVHNEARHLANLKKQQGSGPHPEPVSTDSSRTACNCGGDSGICSCENCTCERCAKNPDAKKGDVEEAGTQEKV